MPGDVSALITGGSQGLGLAIAHRLAAEGCRKMVISGLDDGQGPQAVKTLTEQGVDARFIAADLAEASAPRDLFAAAIEHLGSCNVLVNSAASCARGSVLDTDIDAYDHIMAVNARAPFFLLQEFAKQAIATGNAGAALNISSLQYHCGLPILAGYSMSKAALSTLTKNAANALSRHRIRVNALALGWMDTPGEHATQKKYHAAADDWLLAAERNTPFGKLIKTHEVADLAAYLVTARSGVMTGAVIDYDQTVVGASPKGVGEG